MQGYAQQAIRLIACCLIPAILLLGWLLPNHCLAADQRVNVYVLAGQSNMEGKGSPAHLDTYRDDPLIKPTYAGLKDGAAWRTRNDVWITYPTKPAGPQHGPLTVGYGTKGADSIGPEFGFGHTIGNLSDQPVLLIKIAWGGKSVAVDFRPPSCPPTEADVQRLWERIRKKDPHGTLHEARDRFGNAYRELIRLTKQELASIPQTFPELRGYKPELSGFVWHQGYNDKVNRELRAGHYAAYTDWMIHLIQDVRHDLEAPNLPVVIGELGIGGITARGAFQAAQANIARHDTFGNTVAFVPTAEYYDLWAQELFDKQFWKGTPEQKAAWREVGNDRPYHYLGSGKTYYLKGIAFAEQIMQLQECPSELVPGTSSEAVR
jgi:hypothetical protein